MAELTEVRTREITVTWVPAPGYRPNTVDLVVDAAIQRHLHRLRTELSRIAADVRVAGPNDTEENRPAASAPTDEPEPLTTPGVDLPKHGRARDRRSTNAPIDVAWTCPPCRRNEHEDCIDAGPGICLCAQNGHESGRLENGEAQ